MLLHNRADVTITCLRSLAQSQTNVNWELYLLDNGSCISESDQVKIEFDRLLRAGAIAGNFVRSEINHGFPRGNNLGIRHFLGESDVTHICLMNNDVIVTDYWLDRLLEKNGDAVGPVTNACGNEQTIPVELGTADDVNSAIKKCAYERYSTYRGYCKETNFLGFFCFLGCIELFLNVGLLDERFGQGAYEDDDYCKRILAKGYRMIISRDTFIYHWGTATFSRLPPIRLTYLLKKNRRKFEAKYGHSWEDRSLLPVRSVFDDLEFLSGKNGDENVEMAKLFSIRSMAYINHLLHANGCRKKKGLSFHPFRKLTGNVSKWWDSTLAAKLITFLGLILRNRAILILGRFYPEGSDLNDGYFQRVRLIDENLAEYCRIYVRYEGTDSLTGILPRLLKKKERVYEFLLRKTNVVHCVSVIVLSMICRGIYVHSVLRFSDPISRLLYLFARKRIFDVHGVVPEEFSYEGDEINSKRFGNLERWAVKHASALVVVTHSMADHLAAKYKSKTDSSYSCLSMLPRTDVWRAEGPSARISNGVIYSGGMHKWQQVNKMLEYVNKNSQRYSFTFLVARPDEIRRRYEEMYHSDFPGIVTSTLPDAVSRWYQTHSYGLVLREDITVNRVACPTKLVEYLQHDLIPIVDSPQIGDFIRYGYKYINMNEPLPDNDGREEMVRINRIILRKLHFEFLCGLDQLKNIF